MKKIKLMVLSFCALMFGAPAGFRTANANDKGVKPGDSTTDLLCKGAGVDHKDVDWRVSAGLSPKQAVEVAAQEKFEARVAEMAAKNEKKTDAEIREMAQKDGIDVANLNRTQLFVAMLHKEDADGGPKTPPGPMPPVVKTPHPALDDMTLSELKDYAAKHNVDIAGLTTKADITAAIKSKK